MAATASRSPASARAAASISLLVTPFMAETTTTMLLSRAAVAMISITLRMQEASATEVPPNFITRSGLLAFLRIGPRAARCFESPETDSAAFAVPFPRGALERLVILNLSWQLRNFRATQNASQVRLRWARPSVQNRQMEAGLDLKIQARDALQGLLDL